MKGIYSKLQIVLSILLTLFKEVKAIIMFTFCTEMASFRWTKNWCSKSIDFFLFGLYWHNTTEKQWYRLTGIAHSFELKGCPPVLIKQKFRRLCQENYRGMSNRQTIVTLAHFCS